MKVWIIGFLILFLCFSAEATLDPTRVGSGARSLALGRTTVSMYTNPAYAAELKNWEITSMYTSLLEGEISYTFLGAGLYTNWGTLATSYLGGFSPEIKATTRDAEGRVVFGGTSFDYSSRVLSLIYGKEIQKQLSVGANIKLFNKEFPGYGTGAGFDLNLGLLWKISENLKFSLCQQNTLPASIASISWNTGEKEGIPFNTKVGLSFQPTNNLLLLADFDYPAWGGHTGVEWKIRENFNFRAGLDQSNPTLGLGLEFANFAFDLAYYIDKTLAENSTYYFSLSYLAPEKPEVVSKKITEKVTKRRKKFADVPENYWTKDAIEILAGEEIVAGYPDGTFRPEGNITRAEMCALLIKSKIQTSNIKIKENLFKDVPAKHWAASYIMQASSLGIVKGYPDGTFKPSGKITRAEGLAMIARFAGISEEVYTKEFPDLSSSHWAAKIVAGAYRAGLLEYLKGKPFEASKFLTRAESAEILFRAKQVKF